MNGNIVQNKNEKQKLLADNADLSGSTFHDVNLADAAFDDINLSRAAFSDVNLTRATFRNINFDSVEINDCALGGMRIDGILVQDALAEYRRNHAV